MPCTYALQSGTLHWHASESHKQGQQRTRHRLLPVGRAGAVVAPRRRGSVIVAPLDAAAAAEEEVEGHMMAFPASMCKNCFRT